MTLGQLKDFHLWVFCSSSDYVRITLEVKTSSLNFYVRVINFYVGGSNFYVPLKSAPHMIGRMNRDSIPYLDSI